MINYINEFSKYRLEKRQEINSMQAIINNLDDALRPRDRKLLIASYIVLTYAYWESCFHRFQKLLCIQNQNTPIKNLPYDLKQAVYLKLAMSAASSNRNKVLVDIKSSIVFDNIYKKMHAHDEDTIVKMQLEQQTKYIFIDPTQNPKIDNVEKLIKSNGRSLKKIIEALKTEHILNNYFELGLDFIINQRNAVAHKNEGIIYKKVSYKNFDSCYEALKSDYYSNTDNVAEQLYDKIEDFIQDMSYQIDIFYNKLIEKLIVTESS
jgi:hypothetical protein|nr:MAG TPA: hypothetical protein [Caudoviricetes sp.]